MQTIVCKPKKLAQLEKISTDGVTRITFFWHLWFFPHLPGNRNTQTCSSEQVWVDSHPFTWHVHSGQVISKLRIDNRFKKVKPLINMCHEYERTKNIHLGENCPWRGWQEAEEPDKGNHLDIRVELHLDFLTNIFKKYVIKTNKKLLYESMCSTTFTTLYQLTLRASPVVDLAKGERGRQMARYLGQKYFVKLNIFGLLSWFVFLI